MTQSSEYMAGWRDALLAAQTAIGDRDNYGYVPDIGCFGCFERLKSAVESLTPSQPGTVAPLQVRRKWRTP